MTKVLLGLSLCLGGIIVWLMRRQDHTRTELVARHLAAIDSTNRWWKDSVIVPRQRASAAIDDTVKILQSEVRDAQQRASTARARADSIAKERAARPEPESATDTAWRTMYADVLEENKNLRHALTEQDSALVSQMAMAQKFRLDRDDWKRTADRATETMASLQRDCQAAVTAAQPSRMQQILTAATWIGVGIAAGTLTQVLHE